MGLCIRVERAGGGGHQIVCFGLRLMKSLCKSKWRKLLLLLSQVPIIIIIIMKRKESPSSPCLNVFENAEHKQSSAQRHIYFKSVSMLFFQEEYKKILCTRI